jgi:hypothetical protein
LVKFFTGGKFFLFLLFPPALFQARNLSCHFFKASINKFFLES